MADTRHLIKEHELVDAPEGTRVKIRKVKGNPNIIVAYGAIEVEMSVDEAVEYISAAGEQWVPRMWRQEQGDLGEYSDAHLAAAHSIALKNHEIFKRDAGVYSTMPQGNECYADAHIAAMRWKDIATMMAREITERNELRRLRSPRPNMD